MDIKQIPGGPLALLAAVVILGLMIFGIYWQSSVLGKANAKVQEEKMSLQSAQDRLEQLKQMKKDNPDAAQQLAVISRRIPADPTEDDVIRTIENYSAKAGLNCTEITFAPRVPKTGFSEMPCKVVFEGSYQGIASVMDQMQSGLRVMRIDDVKITNSGGTATGLRAEMTVCAFCKAGATPATGTEQPAPAGAI